MSAKDPSWTILRPILHRLLGLKTGRLSGEWTVAYGRLGGPEPRIIAAHPMHGVWEVTARRLEELPPECLVIDEEVE